MVKMKTEESNYMKYRGRCKEFCEKAIQEDPTLTLVRGHYFDFAWGEQPHWWTVREDGSIYDPTALQFPSQGKGEYVPFNGIFQCSECGKDVKEEEADIEGNFVFCSMLCHGRFVGVY